MYYYFIVNKSSKTGRGGDQWSELESILIEHQVDYEVYFTEYEGHATELAKAAYKREGHINLGVVGGDGTLNEVLNGIEDFERTDFCYVPSGSANDFAKGVGIKGTSKEVLKRIITNEEVKLLDLGEVTYNGTKRVFGVSTGIGVDAAVCYQANRSRLKKILNMIHMGSATYGLLTVGDIFSMPLADATVTYDGKSVDVKNVIFISSMNGAYEGGGIPMVPYAKADSGHLSAFMAHDIGRLHCFFVLPLLILGKHMKVKNMDFMDFSEMTIKMDKPMYIHADGEDCGIHENVTVRCLPQILRARGIT